MYKIILIGLILLTVMSCSKKEDNSRLITKYIQIDKVINTRCQYKGDEGEIIFTVYNDQVLMNPQLSKDNLNFKVYNLINKTFSNKTYKINKLIADTLVYYLGFPPSDMDANSKNIFLLYNRYLLTIDKNNCNNITLVNLYEPFQKLKAFESSLILSRAYNHHPLDAKIPVRIAKYGILSKIITKFIDPTADAIEFSHFSPYNWIDISPKGDIIYTNTLKPKHYLYNANMELKQKLFYTPKNWKDIDKKGLNNIRKSDHRANPGDIIEGLMKTEDGDGCRVISVNFTNDSTLLVFYSAPKKSGKDKYLRYCNVWKVKNNRWVLLDSMLKDGLPEATTTLSRANFPFNGTLNNVKYYKNRAYYISIAPDEDKLFQFGKPFRTVKKEIDKYFAGDKLFYQLYIFDCRF